MRRRSLVAVAGGALVVAAASTAVGTYALFSDFELLPDNRLAAATVVLGAEGAPPPALEVADVEPGGSVVADLVVDYRGTVPAAVLVEIGPYADEPGFCGADTPSALTLQVQGAAAVGYCDLPDGYSVLLDAAVEPGQSQTVTVTVALAASADEAYSGVDLTAGLTVRADAGFTDSATGSIAIRTVDFEVAAPAPRQLATPKQRSAELLTGRAPDPPESSVAPSLAEGPSALVPESSATSVTAAQMEVPAECRDAGMEFPPERIVVLTPDQPRWVAAEQPDPTGPFLVLGTPADDVIVGSDGADCVVSGGGADQIAGGGGDDVLLGAGADDELLGDEGDDLRVDGSGA